MINLEQYRAAFANLPSGCNAAEAEAERTEQLSVETANGQIGVMGCSEQTELFVRASGEKTGMVYTQNLDEKAEDVIAQAYENSKASSQSEPEPMADGSMWENKKLSDTEYTLSSVEALKSFALAFEAELRKIWGKSADIRIGLAQVIQSMAVVNTKGVDVQTSSNRFCMNIISDGGYEGYLSALSLEELNTAYFIEDKKHRDTISQPEITTVPGIYRAVLSSNVVNNILITAWQMFSGKRAANHSTPFADCLGQMIFSPCITICDYKGGRDSKNQATCGFSWQIDCEGAVSEDVTLVEQGVLKGFLHNLSSAAAMETKTTGNAGRKTLLSGNIHTDMAIMPKNFTMESGNASLEELFAACGDGIYVFENYDQFHSLNVVSGDFAFPCKAIRIRDGKPDGLMSGLSMNGNIKTLFSCVELVGKDRAIDPLAMYDSYTVSGPSMLVSALKISG